MAVTAKGIFSQTNMTIEKTNSDNVIVTGDINISHLTLLKGYVFLIRGLTPGHQRMPGQTFISLKII
ncbi:hypothetical protein J415_27150 [Klebsiella michiganensis HKOPL1]|uniref:Uncharacterized protein n=1 Tax=Klebsiella michiganensis (strain ATCC 8724 / DSM 4798 / JCM 20051 / NBRC 3318 / NRRL B-199 / KCTC 1686 / BUCSAV 143 / CCM 1901) TaxID=1006551 RepID=A0A0H3HBS5_KLEM8|nr:hypothetical protein KOX_10570 [Klebsiella michiganensis KCTC 1686]AHW90791.1 hypothetical protein J415_27150 [Klebsiella michiganensis HKOPL1]